MSVDAENLASLFNAHLPLEFRFRIENQCNNNHNAEGQLFAEFWFMSVIMKTDALTTAVENCNRWFSIRFHFRSAAAIFWRYYYCAYVMVFSVGKTTSWWLFKLFINDWGTSLLARAAIYEQLLLASFWKKSLVLVKCSKAYGSKCALHSSWMPKIWLNNWSSLQQLKNPFD